MIKKKVFRALGILLTTVLLVTSIPQGSLVVSASNRADTMGAAMMLTEEDEDIDISSVSEGDILTVSEGDLETEKGKDKTEETKTEETKTEEIGPITVGAIDRGNYDGKAKKPTVKLVKLAGIGGTIGF